MGGENVIVVLFAYVDEEARVGSPMKRDEM